MENKKDLKILGVSIWRIFAYFIIYSVIGFLIETLFAFVNYGVFESRQSFLYGPFCSIYGVGAVIIILVLKYKFFKNNHTLFVGGFLVGSVVEYLVSLFGEWILNVKWWDYSDRFLNINGRICFLYSIFWGLLGVYLLRVINPKIDKFIDWIKSKFNNHVLKIIDLVVIVFMFIDCVISAFAIDSYLIRTSIEKQLPIAHKEEIQKIYDDLYGNDKKSEFIYKHWGNEKMIRTYPNLTIMLEDESLVKVKDYYPDIQSYYYKVDAKRIIQ